MILILVRAATDTIAPDSLVGTTVQSVPYPHQTGIVPECNKYHHVVDGDNCWIITRIYGINIDDFYKWNPGVGRTCEALLVGFYVCIGISSSTTDSHYDCNLPSPDTIRNREQLYRFMQWNPTVGKSCENLLAGYCYCSLMKAEVSK
ncbi:hypothetical protein BDV59DRAFT_193760 [Aspergillus ambiguus]|uniref:LysM peptidoglycan-binding domain-containing protein n=1 Tax=Aspergillus ambiguus TaxID=176160 RepID=UPI003CCCED51